MAGWVGLSLLQRRASLLSRRELLIEIVLNSFQLHLYFQLHFFQFLDLRFQRRLPQRLLSRRLARLVSVRVRSSSLIRLGIRQLCLSQVLDIHFKASVFRVVARAASVRHIEDAMALLDVIFRLPVRLSLNNLSLSIRFNRRFGLTVLVVHVLGVVFERELLRVLLSDVCRLPLLRHAFSL